MSRIRIYLAVAFFAVAVIIFASTDGPRRIYSSGLFAVLGVVLLVNARRGRKPRSE
jgi:hypothetical protein